MGAAIMGFLLSVLSTTVFSWWSIGEAQVQPLTALTVWAGFNLPLFSGAVLVTFLGYVADNLSGGIVGLHMLVYLAIFCASAIAEHHLALNNWIYQMAATGLMSMLSPLIIMGGLMLVSRQYLASQDMLTMMLLQAVLSALFAPAVFLALQGMIRILQKIWPKRQRGQD
jgi:cell shape-determining protein MreD